MVWPSVEHKRILRRCEKISSAALRSLLAYCPPLRMSQRRQRAHSSMASTAVSPSDTSRDALHAVLRGRLGGVVARRLAGMRGRCLVVFELREDRLPAALAGEPLVHDARRLLAVAHGIRNVRRSGDQVAAGKEVGAAGLERVAVHFDEPVFVDAQAGGPHEIHIHGLAHRQNHRRSQSNRRISPVGTGRRRPLAS